MARMPAGVSLLVQTRRDAHIHRRPILLVRREERREKKCVELLSLPLELPRTDRVNLLVNNVLRLIMLSRSIIDLRVSMFAARFSVD